ncbi:hypothetical protein S40288_06086 [Stachybotrys chartarum IBT 40288]|nr:hypothetical protein S40288_06086 [Stachybotrys chartarum IBT 40288]
MAYWSVPFRAEAVDRDPSFYWSDLDDDRHGEVSNDFLGQFVDFGSDAATAAPAEGRPGNMVLPGALLLHHPPESTGSSGISTADEFDFMSSSSQAGLTLSSVGHDVDPTNLAIKAETQPLDMHDYHGHRQLEYAGNNSISDGDLPRLEGISLQSPIKEAPGPLTQPPSPTAPETARRKPNRLRTVPSNVPESPPPTTASFVHGVTEDPFVDASTGQQPHHMRYFGQHGQSTPAISPAMPLAPNNDSSESTATVTTTHSSQSIPATSWPLPDVPLQPNTTDHWGHGTDYMADQTSGWWDLNLLGQQGDLGEQRDRGPNFSMPSQHVDMTYDYGPPIADPGAAGLMIHMPQAQPLQSTVVNDLTLTAQTYLPPPPPPPPPPPASATDRQHRPPRAPSSGARHRNLSTSPMRKTRAPSASPTPAASTSARRHSSGGSISSVRSSSGRLPGSMPGTPCSVRKRRSRDASGGAAAAAGVGGLTRSTSEIGFVNFTPSDGSLLMTGVAPSGSSKTKARREKEAQERRRKLSEAAIKAVAAAGGDVDKLVEHGFAF